MACFNDMCITMGETPSSRSQRDALCVQENCSFFIDGSLPLMCMNHFMVGSVAHAPLFLKAEVLFDKNNPVIIAHELYVTLVSKWPNSFPDHLLPCSCAGGVHAAYNGVCN